MRTRTSKPTNIAALALYNSKNELIIPDVQRDLVWTISQKQLLIDSIMKDFDIPKVYFRDIEKDGKLKYEVVDGQQRLNAIFDFQSDKFPMGKDADPVDGEIIAGRCWSELSSSLQIEFNNRSLDVVHLIGYSDEEMEETFLRLQNGTPLKAPEKRRAISGNMRKVVAELAEHKIFPDFCEFSDVHYAFEDVSAKVLIQLMEGHPTSISATSLRRMYEQNGDIKITDKAPSQAKKSFNFLWRAFNKTNNPHLRKYAIMDLAVLASGLLKVYDLNNYEKEFGQAYLDFVNDRVLNDEKNEEEQDIRFIRYSNSARGDALEYLEYRQKFLREYILEKMPYLTVKDNNRNFTADQRAVIFRLGNGVCAKCGKEVDEEDFEADHKLPWSKGGRTQISNGQVLCGPCNRAKSDHIEDE